MLEDNFNENEDSNTFVRAPSQKERPSGMEHTKRVDAINLIMNKVSEKVASHSTQDTATLQDMWLKIKTALEMTSGHMKTNVENQIMANTHSWVRKSYFDNLYKTIAADAESCAVESNNRKRKAELEKRELEAKEQLVKLQESLQKAADEDLHIADDKEAPDDEEVECEMSHHPENCDTINLIILNGCRYLTQDWLQNNITSVVRRRVLSLHVFIIKTVPIS